MGYDMQHVMDFIFTKKEEYKKLSQKDKEDNFFIVNRKLAREYPKQAQFLNNKIVDKASAMDIWYMFCIKKRIHGTPSWYWFKQTNKSDKSSLKKEEKEYILNMYDITILELNFLEKYYPEEIKEEIKKFKKFNKK